MQIHCPKIKQITRGVYYISDKSVAEIGNYKIDLPKNCYAIPAQNLIFISNRKGQYVWQYISRKGIWAIWQIKFTTKKQIGDVIMSVKTMPLTMIVAKQEGNKAAVLIPVSDVNGKTTLHSEWRYYTHFFNDLIRK